jgi:hypothetical protein
LYEEVSRAPNHFSVVLFLRRCKSTAEKKAKQSLSHNSPEKPTILGKIGHFLGKIKGQFSQHGKTKEKSQNINKKPIKCPYFAASFFPHFPRKTAVFGKNQRFLGKNRGIIGKNPMFLGKMVI